MKTQAKLQKAQRMGRKTRVHGVCRILLLDDHSVFSFSIKYLHVFSFSVFSVVNFF